MYILPNVSGVSSIDGSKFSVRLKPNQFAF